MTHSERNAVSVPTGCVNDLGTVVVSDSRVYAAALEHEARLAVEGVCTTCGSDCSSKSWPKHRRGELVEVLCQSCRAAH